MTATITPSRSTLITDNLQEHLDADASATTGFGNQYLTPSWCVDQCAARLPNQNPASVLDIQAGEGALINLGDWRTRRYSVDVDNRIKSIVGANHLTGNCVTVANILDDLFPELHFECINTNPPFGRKFKRPDGSTIDSTEWTWKFVTQRGNCGFFISNANTIEKLGINTHPWTFHYETHAGTSLWKGMRDTLKIGIVFWKNPTPKDVSDRYDIDEAWTEARRVLDDERLARPNFNIFLDHKGYLRTYLSVRSELKLKLTTDQINRLHQVNDCHPLTLTTEKETRDLMQSLIDCGIYTLQPEAKAAIQSALKEVESLAVPIMPVTPFECVAYAEESEVLDAAATVDGKLKLTAGKRYPISTGTYKFTDKFTRNKVHYDDKTMTTYTKEHECTLSGEDRYIQLQDDNGQMHRFMDRPAKGCDWQHDESLLWGCFHRPVVKTIAEAKPQEMERNAAILKSLAMIAGFEYYEGQAKYLARVAAKDCGLVAGSGGTGKSLMALSIIAMKSPVRALIVAPQGTMRSSENDDDGDSDEDGSADMTASQWIQEIHRFTPYLQVWELFSYEDYERICSLNGGVLPPGLYVTYPEAFFGNFVEQ